MLAGVSSALSLLCNIVMAWNAEGMQAALERIRADGQEPLPQDLRRIAPTNIEVAWNAGLCGGEVRRAHPAEHYWRYRTIGGGKNCWQWRLTAKSSPWDGCRKSLRTTGSTCDVWPDPTQYRYSSHRMGC